ncbi:MAG: GNAT family N-acetyltransferase [Bacteroidales bacterium]
MVEIREIVEPDFENLLALFKELAEFEKKSVQMKNSVERMKQEKDYIRGFVAVEKDKIIGYVIYCFVYYTFSGKAIYLEDIFIKSNYRGTGLGLALIKKVINLAKSENCHKVRWQVSSWNKHATDFYKSLGVEIDDSQRDCHLCL